MWMSGNREGGKRKGRGRQLTVLSTTIVKHSENSGGEKEDSSASVFRQLECRREGQGWG